MLPPIALVLAGAGPRALNNIIDEVMDLTRRHWQPLRDVDFSGKIPILACQLADLKAQGPHAEIWWRFGSREWQTLAEALADTEYLTRTRERIAAQEQAEHEAEERRLEATRCPGCNRREDEYGYKPGASDGTKPCHDCEQEARDTEALNRLLAARAANAAMHPCYTCKGSSSGEAGHAIEVREPADPLRLECPPCDSRRSMNGRKAIILPMPTSRDRRLVKAGKLDDPWWHIRLAHAAKTQAAERHPAAAPHEGVAVPLQDGAGATARS